MNPSPDNSDRLLRLLKLKRYERPPPGYFNALADRVMARLDRMSATRTPSWWEKLLAGLEVKPVLVGAYGMALCGLVLFGISVSQMGFGDSAANAKGGSAWSTAAAAAAALPGQATLYAMPVPLATASLSSMAPVVKQPSSALMDGNTEYELTPVSFNFRIR